MAMPRAEPETPLEFNVLGSSAPCLMGNWFSDRALIRDGHATRVYGHAILKSDSFERVMPNCRTSGSLKGMVSVMNEQMTAVVRAPALGKPLPPPRLAAAQRAIEREAAEAVAAERAPRAQTFERQSENHGQYAHPGAAAYTTRHVSHKGGHPSSISLGPDERGKPVAPAAAPTAGEVFGIAPDAAAYARGWYGSDNLVSEYSARLKHVPGATSIVALTGIELSLQLLFGRLVKRCRDAKLDLRAFVAALTKHGVESEGGGALCVPSRLVRDLAHSINLPFPDGDLEAIIAACDARGLVSLDALRGHIEAASTR